jgi:nucleotide-binding universal stress UspA family protein
MGLGVADGRTPRLFLVNADVERRREDWLPLETETIMYTKLLIATDGSDLALKGVEHGVRLAKALGARVVIYTATLRWQAITATELSVNLPEEVYEIEQKRFAARTLEAATAVAKANEVMVEAVHGPNTYPSDGIVETARAQQCDLIVMASHGRRGVSRLLLGSQANQVVTHSTIPVLIVR